MSFHDSKTKLGPLLQRAGLKITQERLAILDAFDRAKKPLSARDLKDRLKAAAVNQATVYRTIDALVKKNIVRLVNFRHDHNHYELAYKSHHHHLICEHCGKVVDVSRCDTSKIEREVKTLGNFARINTHALEFFGSCKTCVRK